MVFTVLKTVNNFLKIKEEFSIKEKIFYVYYYFISHQTSKNTKNIFYKSFYGETTEP
jgi:hypothetical protein